MAYTSFKHLKEHMLQRTTEAKRVIVANPNDTHTLGAVLDLFKEGLLVPTLVGNEAEITDCIRQVDDSLVGHADITVVPVEGDEAIASEAVRLIREGKGDVLMKGHIQTHTLLKAVVNRETGIRDQAVLSHVSINEVPNYHKLLFISDGGMILTPDLDTKKEILKNALLVTHKLGYEETKVGVLAASESLNEKEPASRDGAALKAMGQEGEFPGAVIEGPISLDLSLSKAIAQEKDYDSPVAGEADILLVPDIVSGNLLGKSFTVVAGGQMAGLIVGAKVPIVLTSRGSTTAEKENSLIIACSF